MGAFIDWLLIRRPTPVEDRTLGRLEYASGDGWSGTRHEVGRQVQLSIAGGRRGPLPIALIAGAEAVRQLSVLEARTREYLATRDKRDPWPPLTLVELYAGVFPTGEPFVVLQFVIEDGLGDVVDVTLVAGAPVEWSRH